MFAFAGWECRVYLFEFGFHQEDKQGRVKSKLFVKARVMFSRIHAFSLGTWNAHLHTSHVSMSDSPDHLKQARQHIPLPSPQSISLTSHCTILGEGTHASSSSATNKDLCLILLPEKMYPVILPQLCLSSSSFLHASGK